MKNFFCTLGLLSVGLLACSGCTKKDTTVPVCTGPNCVQPTTPEVPDASLPLPDAGLDQPDVPTETPDYVTFSGEGWKLTAPYGWEKVILENEEDQPELILVNEEEHSLVFLTKDDFPATIQEYVLMAVAGIQEAGATLHETTQAELNNNKFIVLASSKDGVLIWSWLTVKGETGYNLSCGGPAHEDHHEALCNEIAGSFEIQ